MIQGVCPMCGNSFTYEKGHKKYCGPDCAKEHNRMIARWNDKKKRMNNIKPLSLSELARKAKELGMTYGEYIARTEGGMK